MKVFVEELYNSLWVGHDPKATRPEVRYHYRVYKDEAHNFGSEENARAELACWHGSPHDGDFWDYHRIVKSE